MSDSNRHAMRKQSSLIRTCTLCGMPKTVEPISDQHLKAHVSRRIAFVCVDCAERIRLEVEMAGANPGMTA